MSAHYAGSHKGGSHYLSSHYGRETIIEIPQVHPPGMGPFRRKQIIEEDEIIMTIIMAFLETKD